MLSGAPGASFGLQNAVHNGTDQGAVTTAASEQLVPIVSAAMPLNGQAQPKSHVQSGRRRSSGVDVMTSVHETASESNDQSMQAAINYEVIVTRNCYVLLDLSFS
jgi:hypothetical protein